MSYPLREAARRHYHVDELSRTTQKKFGYDFKRWETLTTNPNYDQIDNETVAEFRSKMIDKGYSPSSVKGSWNTLRTILRRLGPPTDGNPWGLGLIDRVPAMRPVKDVIRRPRRVSLTDISKVYAACRVATYHIGGIPAVDWWRTIMALAYFTILRRGDLWSLEWNQINLDKQELYFIADKTWKELTIPLHPVAAGHLKRIQRSSGLVLPGTRSRYYIRWGEVVKRSGVEKKFGLHDLRRTGASEFDRVRSGLGAYLLQHSSNSVSEKFYLNRDDELREALTDLRVPVGFQAGPSMRKRHEAKLQKQRLELRAEDFAPVIATEPKEWSFNPGGFTFRGVPYAMATSSRLKLLEKLAMSTEAVTVSEVIDVLDGPCSTTRHAHVAISGLRKRLRELFGLDEQYDPVPCVSRGNGGAWTLAIPVSVCADRTYTLREREAANEWAACGNTFRVQGVEFSIRSPRQVAILKLLIMESPHPVSLEEIVAIAGSRSKAEAQLRLLRKILRKRLGFPVSVNPIPATRVDGCLSWRLYIPKLKRRRVA